MKRCQRTFLAISAAVLVAGLPVRAEPSRVTYEGARGPGLGRTIVLVSGDEEYRSEEALPQLGRILSVRHGFTCHVLFAIDPKTGVIDPELRTNIPGLELLADADLMIIATRFRDLPDDQMRHVDAYVRSGRPVIGLRTATHAFALEGSTTYRRYTWNFDGPEYEQGFGRQVLGETWIAHHGRHGAESTRGVAAPGMDGHPILRGIEPGSIWGPTDVYRVRLPLPSGCTPVVLGQVLDGMQPGDDPVAGAKNEPMMPVAWTRTRGAGDRPGPERVFTTTMGAATDLVAEGTRRMLVNAAYWALGMADGIPAGGADVRLVGRYAPTDFGFGGFRRGVRPEDHAWPEGSASSGRLRPDDRVVVVGNTFAERLAQSGVFDAVAHAAHPGHRLVIRHVPWSGDEAGLRPRERAVPTMLEWIERLDADVVFLFFGMSESFSPTPEAFEADLRELVTSMGSRRLVLVSPIAHENLGPPWDVITDFDDRNEAISAVTAVMERVAADEGVRFVNLFDPALDAYDRADAALTTNGIHPTEAGCAAFMDVIAGQLGWLDGVDLPGPGDDPAPVDALRALACDKHYYFRLRYRPTNTEYVWGRRKEPFGIVNFPPEMAQLERMVAARERAMTEMTLPSPAAVLARAAVASPQWPRTPTQRVFPEDRWTPAPVEAKGTETSLGSVVIDDPETFHASFTVADGYVVECFVSERDFAEVANPLAMTFDDRGRLWLLCVPTYPHLLPGARGRCRLVILEDTSGDGRADRCTVFAEGFEVPMGFAVDTDAVYVGQAPDLLRLVDTDGDDRADVREVVLSGFGMPDSHHQLGAFEWDPSGGLLMHEGVFTKSNVETPWGTRRTQDAAVWRFDPRTGRLQVLSHCHFANPWGHAFDDFGASVLADASGGNNYSFSHVSLPFTYPHKPEKPPQVLHRGRPTAGCEIVASRHFPDDVQGTFLVNQSIGFHGTRWDRLTAAGSTWTATPMPQDLLSSSDTNFRPVAMEIGPDGALYVVDWCNTIVGHMQYSVRDPRRDHAHGRVWRIRHADRPLLDPPDVHDAAPAALLELLRLPEHNTRQLARRRLQGASWATIRPALAAWGATLRPEDPLYDRLIVEDLWIRHAHGRAGPDHVERALGLDEPRARAAAVRVLRHLLQAGDVDLRAAAPLLDRVVHDDDMRVRLEAVVAAGFLPAAQGLAIAAGAELYDMDEAMRVVFREVLSYLAGGSDVGAVPAVVERIRLERMPASELLALPLDDVGAGVRLVRSDVPLAPRREALEHLVGTDASMQAAELVARLGSARGDEAIRVLGAMLASMPEETLAAIRDDARAMMRQADPARRAVGAAVLMRSPMLDVETMTPDTLVAAAGLLDEGQTPDAVVAALRLAVTEGRVDPAPAIEQLVRHAEDRVALAAWLVELVDAVEDAGFDRWGAAHERAMAALGGLQSIGSGPRSDDRYRLESVSAERLEAGRGLFADEEEGCARCHGVRGQGLEGFPPLARSPWVLGEPRRAASAVLHGLYGRVRLPDGRSFNAVMEPAGATLSDEELALILTYVRRSWGNFATAVSADEVAAARAAAPEGGGSWEAAALLARYPLSRDTIVPVLVGETMTAPEPSLLASLVRQLIVYLVPPLATAAFIILVLSRNRPAARSGPRSG